MKKLDYRQNGESQERFVVVKHFLWEPVHQGASPTLPPLLEVSPSPRKQARNGCRAGQIIGRSHAMQRVFQIIERVAPTNATVLISGRTGTGKELVARAIHYNSSRASMPFVDINCGALPEQLAESELFGHQKGAFTGASESKRGLFETAHGGTLFFDEVQALKPDLQAKLLRSLQERVIRRVGGRENIAVDVRVIASTFLETQHGGEQSREASFFKRSDAIAARI